MTTSTDDPPAPRHAVTAVLVVHEGARWLPAAVSGLAGQTRAPDVLVVVTTGDPPVAEPTPSDRLAGLDGLDGPTGLAALPAGHLSAAAPRFAGYGASLRAGLAEADRAAADTAGRPGGAPDVVDWLWLLHDDVDPEPAALAALLAHVSAHPDVAVAGPKVRGWNDRRLLLEVGVTVARNGRRETGLERRERDQGQHDTVRPVLSVSSAGMLVRRDVWDALAGFDPGLALFRDDLDFCWRANLAGHRVVCVPDAVVHHAEAAAHGRRRADAVRGHHQRADRAHAAFALLANLPLLSLPWTLVRLLVSTTLRSLGLLLGKRPGLALGEAAALAGVLVRPDRLAGARWSRRRTRAVPARSVNRLLAPRGSGLRHSLEALSLVVTPTSAVGPGAGRHRVVESGPGAEEMEDLPSLGSTLVRRLARLPVVPLLLGLLVLALLAGRDLFGAGRLMGGALLPAPDAASELWRTYTEGWHPVGVGSDTPAPPYLAVMGALGTLLLGNAGLAVDLLLLGAVPLAGLSAYLSLRGAVPSRVLRVWAATTYALLPAVVGAVAAGRIGTVAVAVLLPPAGVAAARALGAGGRPASSRAAWTYALLVAVMAGFVPAVYLMSAALVVAAVVVDRGLLRSALVALAAPPVLLLPWLPAVLRDPQLLLLESGFPGPGLSDPDLPPWALALLHPGGPGMYPVLLSAGLLLAGLAALLRAEGRGLVLAGWAAALVGLTAAVLTSRFTVTAPTLETSVVAWPGPGTLLAGAGLVLAAAGGGAGARERIARSAFGWRQPASVVLVVAAGLVPVTTAAWWAWQGAGEPLERRDPVLLPAFIADEGQQAERPRTLVLRGRDDGRLAYALLREDGPRLGDAETAPPADAGTGLDDVVADLASGRGSDATAALVPYGVRFVLASTPVDPGLARALGSAPGLVRVSGPAGSVVWRISYPTGRLLVLAPQREGGPDPRTDALVLASGEVGAQTGVPAGAPARELVVADQRDAGFRAALDGRALAPRTYGGWAQAFDLPASGGRLELGHEDRLRVGLLWVQAAALLLVVALALPGARPEDDPDAAAAEPAGAARRPAGSRR